MKNPMSYASNPLLEGKLSMGQMMNELFVREYSEAEREENTRKAKEAGQKAREAFAKIDWDAKPKKRKAKK